MARPLSDRQRRLLVALLDGPAFGRDLDRRLGVRWWQAPCYLDLWRLDERWGLVRSEPVDEPHLWTYRRAQGDDPPRRRRYDLTPQGREVAQALATLERVLGEAPHG